ncbi:hypothetical protein GCM10011349_19950 [Novosphingobium indicum]|uniref:Uncharacterized protein n=1 Tax=Novosphingobium indicum TaxID=462949 RepID=A0ABQ2JL15_9SPHN|nr:hypothetical protein [Novosphingobium indicum]GGN49375.1 hypothetical protein GCM10011349_19950 [Novosphingobium indicum]
MPMIVGCKLPHGLEVTHKDATIVLNGANVGYDADNPWKNGASPDNYDRTSGVGLTTLSPDQEEPFKDWLETSGKGPGPVRSGLIFVASSKNDASKEAQALEGEKTGLGGLDPEKDLPKGVETDTDTAGKSGKKG